MGEAGVHGELPFAINVKGGEKSLGRLEAWCQGEL